MPKTTTVYEVTAFAGAEPVQFFFGLKWQAHVKSHELRDEGYTAIAIVPNQITLNATGVAEALQTLVDYHCVNEH